MNPRRLTKRRKNSFRAPERGTTKAAKKRARALRWRSFHREKQPAGDCEWRAAPQGEWMPRRSRRRQGRQKTAVGQRSISLSKRNRSARSKPARGRARGGLLGVGAAIGRRRRGGRGPS